jgi:hypothetical protein
VSAYGADYGTRAAEAELQAIEARASKTSTTAEAKAIA